MKYILNLNYSGNILEDLLIFGIYSRMNKEKNEIVLTGLSKEIKESFLSLRSSNRFKGEKDTAMKFNFKGCDVLFIGLGEKSKVTSESLRKDFSKLYKKISSYEKVSINLDSFSLKGKKDITLKILVESFELTKYKFDKYLSDSKKEKIKEIGIDSIENKASEGKWRKVLEETKKITESINISRDFVNEPPNVLRSTEYSKRIIEDISKIKGVKVLVLGRKELKKEKMGLFLSVNDGSNFDAQLVHLTYTPQKMTKNTKHIALVGKGLVFDTGGYSLKTGGAMMNMKYDMAGSATMYGAFRAASLMKLDLRVTCILGITDNAVNGKATMPDSVVKARNGKTVEILNTDAEGRLVLADCLDYACDQGPDVIIDAATLTGACIHALGNEVCALVSNDRKLSSKLLKSAEHVDEYMWELPIIPEWSKDMKGNLSDLKNIGGASTAGTAKAAAFLQEFVKNDISWAHLDIAGVADSQAHLPYCPSKGGSGLIIRSLINFLQSF